MPRLVTRFLIASVLMAGLATSASARLVLRSGVHPESFPICREGHYFSAITNTGDRPVLVVLSLALLHDDMIVRGPRTSRFHLAAGETKTHRFPFSLPPDFRPGRYAFVSRAHGSDGSEASSRAPFFVLPGPCDRPPGGDEGGRDALGSILRTFDEDPPVVKNTWGSIKALYR